MGMVINRFDVYLVNFDPTRGHEIKKTRPCVIISPNEINHNISTVIVAPMTTKGNKYPTRIPCTFQNKTGQIVIDQIRTIDKLRLIKKLGTISSVVQKKILHTLKELFAE